MAFIPGIAEQQVDQGAFLWTLRERRARGHRTDAAELALIDARLASHLRGLRLAGPEVWPLCREPLARPSLGEVFLAASVALRLGEAALPGAFERECLTLTGVGGQASRLTAAHEIAAALAWAAAPSTDPTDAGVGVDAAHRWLNVLETSPRALERRIALSARVAVRVAPGVEPSLTDADGRVRARAARAVGELGRVDLLPGLVRALTDRPTVAAWSAWSLALLGADDARVDRVLRAAVAADVVRSPWMVLVASRTAAGRGDARWATALRGVPGVLARVALGRVADVEWLLRHVGDPTLGWLAADGFITLTGASTHRAGPTDEPARAARRRVHAGGGGVPPETGRALRDWWAGFRHTLPSSGAMLGGKPISPDAALPLLAAGTQGVRRYAAVAAQAARPSAGLFPVAAPSSLQERLLRGWLA